MITKTGNTEERTLGHSGANKTPRRLLILPLVLLPLLLGGARPWFWSIVAAVFAVSLVWSVWSGMGPTWVGNTSKKWLLGLGLLLLYPLFQSVPLSASWITLLSPSLMVWKERAHDIAQASIGQFSISYEPLVSFFSGLWWVFLAAYALCFRRTLQEEADPEWFYYVLFWVASFEAFYGLLQTLIPSLGVLWESAGQGVARGTFVNRNHYAAFLGMVWPVLFAYVLSMRTASQNGHSATFSEHDYQKDVLQKRWFLGFLIGLMLLALFFSQSRGGILGVLISLTVFIAFGKRHRKKGTIAFLAGCWLIMSIYGSLIGFDQILARFNELGNEAPGRVNIWQDTWLLIQDHWLTGTGLGTFPEVIRIYQTHLSDQFDIVHAHNDYLELAGDVGVPIAALMVLLIWGYWWVNVWRVIGGPEVGSGKEGERKRSGSGVLSFEKQRIEKRKLIALGALAGSAAFLCHSWVEFNWQIPANQLYFVVLVVLMKV